MSEGERVQKLLAAAGLGSRRACEELIAAGRVSVNGEQVGLGARADPDTDTVEVDGALVAVRAGLVHYVLNKPAGVVSTASDPQRRTTVVDLVPSEPRVFPVGRLDADSEGLLLLTNDGELAHRLTHPSFGVEKEYVVEVEGRPAAGALRALREGVELDDGPTAPARVSAVSASVLRIEIHEGRNRQVRRMCEAVGHPVRRLVRTRIGPLADRSLGPGAWRPLTPAEVRGLATASAVRRYVAAGGVVVDDGEESVLVLRGAERAEVRLPKGEVDAGESVEEAARREIGEEAGVAGVEWVADLGGQVVRFRHRGRDVERYERYHVYRRTGDKQAARPPEDVARFEPTWLPWDEAERALSFDEEREWLRRARRALRGRR